MPSSCYIYNSNYVENNSSGNCPEYFIKANMTYNSNVFNKDIDKVNKRFGLNIQVEKTSERQTGEAEAMKGSTVRYAGSKGGDTL